MLIDERRADLIEQMRPYILGTITRALAADLSPGDVAFVILERSSQDGRALLDALGQPSTPPTPGAFWSRDMLRKELEAALAKAAVESESVELAHMRAVTPKAGALHVLVVDETGWTSVNVEAEPKRRRC